MYDQVGHAGGACGFGKMEDMFKGRTVKNSTSFSSTDAGNLFNQFFKESDTRISKPKANNTFI